MSADKADTGVVNAGETQRLAPSEQVAETVVPEVAQTPETYSLSGVMDNLGIPAEIQEELQPPPEVVDAVEDAVEPEPVEVEAEPEAEAEDEEPSKEEDAEAEPEEKHQWPVEAIKLKDKYRRQRNEARDKAAELEDQVRQLQEQIETAPPATVSPTMVDPLVNVTDEAGLQKARAEAKILRDYCRERRQGFTLNEGTAEERWVPPEEIAKSESYAEDMLAEYIPQKAAELQARPQFTGQAKLVLPTMFETGHADAKAAKVMLVDHPWLASDPARDLKIAVSLVGWKTIMAQQAAKETKPETDKKLQVPDELKQQHLNRGKVPVLRQNPPSRVNGNSPSHADKAKPHPLEKVMNDQSSVSLGAAMREMRDATPENSRRPTLV
ncbi:MAG: hypothetical protein H0W34_05075 [Pyrinomonadaceae bacterium]|jgi:hypothetical protein|nr:hypothetical protein [Pyrinomonadaceae bacterium]